MRKGNVLSDVRHPRPRGADPASPVPDGITQDRRIDRLLRHIGARAQCGARAGVPLMGHQPTDVQAAPESAGGLIQRA